MENLQVGENSGGLGGIKAPRTRGENLHLMWAGGEGLEIGWRGGRWTVGEPRPAVRGGPGCARDKERDSWAVVERPQGGGDWFLATPPKSTLSTERVPVSSGWGLGILSRIGGEDPCWDGEEGCLPTRIKVGAGVMTRKVLFPGPERPS